MFEVRHKETGIVRTVYAVMGSLALIFTGDWEWVDLNNFLPAEVTEE